MYKRIVIVGAGGSGKTTLSEKISEILKIPHKSTDDFRYSLNFKRSFPIETTASKIRNFIKKKRWIVDGVYNEEYILPIIKKADTVIILNSSRIKLIYRILKREIQRRKSISEMFKLIYWSQKYKSHNENRPLLLIKKYNKRVIFLKNNDELNNFLRNLKYN